MPDITLDFIGPFKFTDGENSVFSSPVATCPGLYLWAIRQSSDQSHLIHYVGETAALAARHREHLINILGLNYGIFNPERAQQGVCELIWPGLWRDKSPSGPARQIGAYVYHHEMVIGYVSVLNIFFAEIHVDSRLRKHIEGCIGWNLRKNHPDCKVLYPDDNRVGTSANKDNGVLRIHFQEPIRGLDEEIPY